MNKSTIKIVGYVIILAGLVGILTARITTPQFAARYFSPDQHLDPGGVEAFTSLQLIAQVLSVSMILGGGAMLPFASTFSNFYEKKLSTFFASRHFILIPAICLWAILYLIYVLMHDIPVNPGGFYLESASQLIHNGFLIPKFVEGFGEQGIPFAYPPLGIYLYATMGYLLGSVYKAALYIPGILLPLQAVAAYSFMKQWNKSEQVSQWTAVSVLLMPHLFARTISGDGITTGLAGVFLLLSWRSAVMSDRLGSYRSPLIGGFFVGCSILSHPAIGLFSAVTFTILYLAHNGIHIKSMSGLVLSGLIAFVTSLPWLLTVVAMHGFDPILASLQDSKSPLSISIGIHDTLSYIFDKHTGDISERIAFLLIPPALLYIIFRGPRIVLLLLLAGLLTFKGHPSVTIFAFAISIGFFYSDFLLPMISRWRLHVEKQEDKRIHTGDVSFRLLFTCVHLAVFFLLCLPYIVKPAFSSGELKTYEWVGTRTEPNSTFIMEGVEENLVFFGRRHILLPVLGAEWILNPEYGNGQQMNGLIRKEIYTCRQPECITNAFSRYQVTPDFIIYRISSDEEQAWVEELDASPMFEIVFKSEPLITLKYDKRETDTFSDD